MGREFRIEREFAVPGTPEQVWHAITDGAGGWLWPMEYEPRVGGAAEWGSTVTAWDPPRHLAILSKDASAAPEGAQAGNDPAWFNLLEQIIETRNGVTWVRYVHAGVMMNDWETEFDGANQHTDFYLDALVRYLQHFAGCRPTYISVDGPQASTTPGSLGAVRRALGLTEEAREGDRLQLAIPGVPVQDAEVDYANAHFLGLRTDDALIRVFARDAWGAPTSISVHHFAPDVDVAGVTAAWTAWLNGLFPAAS